MTAAARVDYRLPVPASLRVASVRTPRFAPRGGIGARVALRVRVFTTHGDFWVIAVPAPNGWRPGAMEPQTRVDASTLPVRLLGVCLCGLANAVHGSVTKALRAAEGEWWLV